MFLLITAVGLFRPTDVDLCLESATKLSAQTLFEAVGQPE
jgi:hypothetical protein